MNILGQLGLGGQAGLKHNPGNNFSNLGITNLLQGANTGFDPLSSLGSIQGLGANTNLLN